MTKKAIPKTTPSKEVLGSVRSKRRYKSLVNLCTRLLLGSPPKNHNWSSPKIKVAWEVGFTNKPDWWPGVWKGNSPTERLDNCWISEYSVYRVLEALYNQGLSDYGPKQIFERRVTMKNEMRYIDMYLEGIEKHD